MGSCCARPIVPPPASQGPSSAGDAWAPTRASGLGATTRPMTTHRPITVQQAIVEEPRAPRSESGDDEYGVEGSQPMGGSVSGASASFPHLVAIQHLRNQAQAETAASSRHSTTPKRHSSKKMALLGAGHQSSQGIATSSTVQTTDFNLAQNSQTAPIGAANSLSQASLPSSPPIKEKREKRDKHAKKEKRDKRERHRADPSIDNTAELPLQRSTSLAESTASQRSSSCTSNQRVMSISGGSNIEEGRYRISLA